jgi:PAS domain S-box-containing protein
MPHRRLFKRPFTIRQWSALLVAVCVLPSLVAVSVLVYFSYLRERANTESLAIGITRALMQAIDRDLSNASGALRALATSPYLTDDNLEAFYRQASELASHGTNTNIVLIGLSGRQIINTLRPYGTALPLHGDLERVREVIKSGQQEVSNLYFGTVANHYVVSVDLPVMRDGKVKYILSMQSFPDRLEELLARQRVPDGWVATVLDGNAVVVARSRDAAHFIGKPATPGLRNTMAQAIEGSVEDRTLEGIPSVAFFTRSAVSSWTVAIGVHRALFTRPLMNTVGWTIALLILVFAAVTGLAVAVAARIARSVRGLIQPAMALGYGGHVQADKSDLLEAEEVAHALQEAAFLLKQRTAERDQAAAAQRELQEAKHEVEQNESFLDGVFQESPDGVFLVEPDGRILRANAEAMHMFGAGDEQLAALRIDDLLLAPKSNNRFRLCDALFTPATRHAVSSDLQLLARRRDGIHIPVEVMASPLHLTGSDFAIVTIRDVSERVRNEEARRQSEKRFRNALEHAPIGMAIVSLEGRWIEVNNAACEMLGYSREELTSLTFQEITYADDLEADLEQAGRLLRGEIRSYQMEKRYVRKDGLIIPALLTGTVVRDDAGNPEQFIAQIIDISERKRAEEELKALTNRLALATRAGGIGVWELDLCKDVVRWDERMEKLYGRVPEEGMGGYEVWHRCLHPGDVKRVENEVAEAIEGSGDFASEFRIVRPDGETRIVYSAAIISRDKTGKGIRMTGINIDVTENRRREEAINIALKEKEMLLKELYHRVKNNLQMITSMFNLQVRSLPQGTARVALTEAAGRVRAMALVHEKLYQSGNLSSIALDTYTRELCAQLAQVGLSAQRKIEIRVDVEALEAGIEAAIPLGVMLNELISNCYKHAFPDGRDGIVTVRTRRKADETGGKRIHLSVADDGVGFPHGFNAASSSNLGLKLVAALTRQLHGELETGNRDGACVDIVFPLNDVQGEEASARMGEIA